MLIFSSLNAQSYVKHFESKLSLSPLAPWFDEQRFTCLTKYNENLLIAGTVAKIDPPGSFPPTRYGMSIFEVTKAGTPLNQWLIEFGSIGDIITPMGIIVDGNFAIVCGTYGYPLTNNVTRTYEADIDNSNGFVLKYDMLTSSIVWISRLNVTPASAFLDIASFTAGNYIVCGEVESLTYGEDACIYSVNASTGVLSLMKNYRPVNFSNVAGKSSDTFYSIFVDPNQNNNINVVGRFEFPGYQGEIRMRPVYCELASAGTILSEKYYVVDSINQARLYNLDITKAGNSYIQISTGDIDGSVTYQDLLVKKTDLNGVASWIKRYDWTSTPRDGKFHSVKAETSGTGALATNNYIIWGSAYLDDGSLPTFGKPFILRLGLSGNVVNSRFYDEILVSTTLCPNSMIVWDNAGMNTDEIFAVGYFKKDGREVGALLHSQLPNGDVALCDQNSTPSVSNNLFQSGFVTSYPPEAEIASNISVSTSEQLLPTVFNAVCSPMREESETYLNTTSGSIIFSNNTIFINQNSGLNNNNKKLKVYNGIGELVFEELINGRDTFILDLAFGYYIATIESNSSDVEHLSFIIK